MTRDDVFGEKEEKWWLRPPDLKKEGTVLTIEGVDTMEFGKNREKKAVVRFNEIKKRLILNENKFDRIVDITGQDDTDDWAGEKLHLCPIVITIKENGVDKEVETIAVKPPEAPVKALLKPIRKPAPAAAPTGRQIDDDNDEIPF